ncbi:uncharacterized protein TNCV_2668521 [Trichonephila clavipes]|nr:uncharacterized protein TNCV_2668521 [Trichonephila clavipes]
MAHIWGGIILDSRTDLHVKSVTMTGHIFRDSILEQHVRLFQGAIGAELLFMDDNARPHHANCRRMHSIGRYHPFGLASILTGLESNRACVGYAWPMNCRPSPHPNCLPELRSALLDELCNIPQDQIDNLILIMLCRCKACIASPGRHTPY